LRVVDAFERPLPRFSHEFVEEKDGITAIETEELGFSERFDQVVEGDEFIGIIEILDGVLGFVSRELGF
jgi:hypothetical protein